MALLLANATLASVSGTDFRSGHVIVEGDRISSIDERLPVHITSVFDCSGRLLLPGNVCAHTHLYSALARGMPGPRHSPRNFVEILKEVWWKLDQALDEDSIRLSGLVGALDAIRSGTTTVVDHHASPNAIDGSLDVLADAVDRVGLRALLCYEVTDRGGTDGRQAGLRENERFLRTNTRPRIRGTVGAHASFTLEDATLIELAELARDRDTGVHIHVAEDRFDEDDALRRSGKRAAIRLADAGILVPQSIAAHGVHLDGPELAVVEQHQSWFVHNCRSNMNNSVGRAPIFQFGARTALGTDGIDEDMFAESRAAFLRGREDSLAASAERILRMLRAAGEMVSPLFSLPIGHLEEGSAADLIVLRYDPPTPLSGQNLAWHWMFALTPQNVESVMVGGEWVLKEGEMCRVDEEKIRAEARREAAKLWNRMEAL